MNELQLDQLRRALIEKSEKYANLARAIAELEGMPISLEVPENNGKKRRVLGGQADLLREIATGPSTTASALTKSLGFDANKVISYAMAHNYIKPHREGDKIQLTELGHKAAKWFIEHPSASKLPGGFLSIKK